MVRHILADGREVESVKGFVIPPTGATAAVYHIAAEFLKNHSEVIYQEQEKRLEVATTA